MKLLYTSWNGMEKEGFWGHNPQKKGADRRPGQLFVPDFFL